MKPFRLLLVLLLVMLLPVRGVLAVGMSCAQPGSGNPAQAVAADHAHAHQEASAHDHAAAHGHAAGGAHDHTGAADKCSLCAASCSAAGLVSAPMTLAEPQPVSTVFPRLRAPPASFVSDGQERPPRSI